MPVLKTLIPPGAKILDAGCGIGRDMEMLINNGFDMTGVEAAPGMIKEAIKRNSLLKGKVIEGDLREISSLIKQHEQFNAIWANTSFHHHTPKEAVSVLSQYKQLLKPDGILFILVKKGNGEIFEKAKAYSGGKRYFKLYQVHELDKILTDAGLSIIDIGEKPDSRGKPFVYAFAKKITIEKNEYLPHIIPVGMKILRSFPAQAKLSEVEKKLNDFLAVGGIVWPDLEVKFVRFERVDQEHKNRTLFKLVFQCPVIENEMHIEHIATAGVCLAMFLDLKSIIPAETNEKYIEDGKIYEQILALALYTQYRDGNRPEIFDL